MTPVDPDTSCLKLANIAEGKNEAAEERVFATPYVREHHPLPEASAVDTAVDGRRLRALIVRELEQAAAAGDTLRTQESLVTAIRKGHEARNESGTAVSADLLAVVEEENFPGEVRIAEMADARRAYQLERLGKAGDLIRTTVNRRLEGQRHDLSVDWRAELDQLLPHSVGDAEEVEKEERARVEKAAALAELAAARLSVLIGPAGTGKTTLLSALCRRPEIYEDRILLLAPTGKARVRIEDVLRKAGTQNFQAFTLAQFLSRSKPPRYDGSIQRYLLTGQPGEQAPKTVIVDESSMLTEEMMAALLESLAGVQRLIFVGDHHQLPPIGAGRPFADTVAKLKPSNIESAFPRVAPGYAELTVPRRQGAGERDDLQLASWFGGNGLDPGEDQVFEILAGKRSSWPVSKRRS
ncbi:MAG: AAA family ATPase [Anaerolineaceae bacterium]